MPDLRQLLDAATPGPWLFSPGSPYASDDDGYQATVLADNDADTETTLVAVCWASEDEPGPADRDAALIVALRNAAPALLAVVDAARDALVEYDRSTDRANALRAALTDLDEVTRA